MTFSFDRLAVGIQTFDLLAAARARSDAKLSIRPRMAIAGKSPVRADEAAEIERREQPGAQRQTARQRVQHGQPLQREGGAEGAGDDPGELARRRGQGEGQRQRGEGERGERRRQDELRWADRATDGAGDATTPPSARPRRD